MTPLKIVLEGKSSITRQPERGALVFVVHTSGPSRETVSKEAIETVETITGSPVTTFSSTSLQTDSKLPRDKSGMPLPTIYNAIISLNALFQDFTKPSEIIAKLISYPNIDIKSLDWCLTEATQKALDSESHEKAMRGAVEKANEYTRVIGREFVAVEISELRGGGQFEMRYNSIPHMQQMHQMQQEQMTQSGVHYSSMIDPPASKLNVHTGASPGLDLGPQLTRYTNAVQVEFQAVRSCEASS
ncbi:hypothetical protein N7517_009454 [Penicillium concentricum]|uniref:Uncharacterized protein n=1 Tax=Penicillium concentricum TaxID=293559 RepID=A0A9W9UWM7_9EURO|nr:uncharacterized protein N7517_009454 [Penicillium concentricum]KAJ5360263.1 hypothetical protein N7517_009454 [Penicillium concentricum]